MKLKLPIVSSLSVVLTGCSANGKDTSESIESVENPSLIGNWLCFEMDAIGFPIVYSAEDIQSFTSNNTVVGMQKAVFMSVTDGYDGTLTSHFYYEYSDGTEGVLEVPLPLTVEGSYPYFEIQSYEGDAGQAEIILDCRLSESRLLGCGYTIGGTAPAGSSISFRPLDGLQ